MAEFFGSLERLAADLYPYRWLISAGLLIALAGTSVIVYRKGWHIVAQQVLWRHRLITAAIGVPTLALLVYGTWELGSPLFLNKTVIEEFPFASVASVSQGVDREDKNPSGESLTATQEAVNLPTAEVTSDSEAPDIQQVAGPVALKSGNFRDQDSIHKGSGLVTIYRGPDGSYLLRLEDFKVTNGPDLHVILTPHPNPGNRSEVNVPGYVDLGVLKGNIGSQNYPIPDDVDITEQGSVVIYCKPFHVVFSVATLQDVG